MKPGKLKASSSYEFTHRSPTVVRPSAAATQQNAQLETKATDHNNKGPR